MIIAENFRGRFIDETDLVGSIDHQQAFAQVLHDVLGQFGQVCQVEILLSNQGFAFAHAAG